MISKHPKTMSLGFDNVVVANRVIAIVKADASPIKRLKEDARKSNKLVDATSGRRTRSVIITDSDHIILSSALPGTLKDRLEDA